MRKLTFLVLLTLSPILSLAGCGGGGGDGAASEANLSPVADAALLSPASEQIKTGSLVTLDASDSYDPENEELTYLWELVSRPQDSNAALSDPTARRPSFTADQAGEYTVSLVVADGMQESAEASVTVSVSAPPPPGTPREGTFLDSFVDGLDYGTIDFLVNVTGEGGKFDYLEGDDVTFSLGELLLGTVRGQEVITPLDLVPGAKDETDPTVTTICRLLQSLDDDSDLENGILIAEAIKDEVSAWFLDFATEIDEFDDSDMEALFERLNQQNLFAGPEDRVPITAAGALKHFRQLFMDPFKGEYYGEFSGDDSGSWIITVNNTGSIQGTATGSTTETLSLTGITTSQGEITFTSDAALGAPLFSGQIFPGNEIEGTWSNPDTSEQGVFSGKINLPNVDDDNDGFTEEEGDCSDYSALLSPGTQEICGDLIDQDCDGFDAECPPPGYDELIEGTILGYFKGFTSGKIFVQDFPEDPGKVRSWLQADNYSEAASAYRPGVKIYRFDTSYSMHVVGMAEAVTVQSISCTLRIKLTATSFSGETLTVSRTSDNYTLDFQVDQADRATVASWSTADEIAVCKNGGIIKNISRDEQSGVTRIQ